MLAPPVQGPVVVNVDPYPLVISMANVLRRPVALIGSAFTNIARRIPGTTALASPGASLAAQSVPALTATAVVSYLLAGLLPGSSRPVLAPLTAILVMQATRYQTLRNAVQRVGSVVAGVVVALGFTTAVGFTWWSLGLVIAVGLVIGSVLRLGDHILEVPISAMLILALGSGSAATGRVVDTLVGAAAGLAGGMIFLRVRTQPAEEAIADFSQRMASLLDEMASGVTDGAGAEQTATWLTRARSLTSEIQEVDDRLGEAEDSLRLTPSKLRSDRTAVPLRNGLEALEHASITIRGLTRSLTDDAQLPERDAAALAAGTHDILARVLGQLAAAVRAYGSLIRADTPRSGGLNDDELGQHLAQARDQREQLARIQHHTPEPASAGSQLRGEMILHLDRLASELQVERLHNPSRDSNRITRIRAASYKLRHLAPARPNLPAGARARLTSRPPVASRDRTRRPGHGEQAAARPARPFRGRHRPR